MGNLQNSQLVPRSKSDTRKQKNPTIIPQHHSPLPNTNSNSTNKEYTEYLEKRTNNGGDMGNVKTKWIDPDFCAPQNFRYASVDRLFPGTGGKFCDTGFVFKDIGQGALGSCWFLAVLNGVLELELFTPSLIPPLQHFENERFDFVFFSDNTDTTANTTACYAADDEEKEEEEKEANNRRSDGWKRTSVDSYLAATDRGQLVFCRNKSSSVVCETWPALMEKAFAKFWTAELTNNNNNNNTVKKRQNVQTAPASPSSSLDSSYDAEDDSAMSAGYGTFSCLLRGGYVADAVQALVGKSSISKHTILETAPIAAAPYLQTELFARLERLLPQFGTRQAVCITFLVGKNGETDQTKNEVGILYNHAYTVLNAFRAKGQRFVTVHNPWAFSEFNVDNDTPDDGTWTMSFEHFLAHFSAVDLYTIDLAPAHSILMNPHFMGQSLHPSTTINGSPDAPAFLDATTTCIVDAKFSDSLKVCINLDSEQTKDVRCIAIIVARQVLVRSPHRTAQSMLKVNVRTDKQHTTTTTPTACSENVQELSFTNCVYTQLEFSPAKTTKRLEIDLSVKEPTPPTTTATSKTGTADLSKRRHFHVPDFRLSTEQLLGQPTPPTTSTSEFRGLILVL